jgi:hypothetical protein
MNYTHLHVVAEARYWEDSSVNGHNDTEGTLIPFRDGETWRPVIRLEDGFLVGWPEGMTASIHYKVCDAGEYWLGDETTRSAKWRGDYVPDSFLCHGDEGFGDYIIFNVGADGKIEGYRKPSIDHGLWKSCCC